MLRGCLTVLLILGGVFLIGAALSAEPCRRDPAGEYVVLLGSLSLGAAAFFVAHARTRRTWIAVTTAIATALVAGFGSIFFGVLQWAGECAS